MAFDPKRIDRLATKATLLEEQAHALVKELEELAELARDEVAAPVLDPPTIPDPSVADAPIEEPPVDSPPKERPPDEAPPAEDLPPVEEPPVEEPPVGPPPVEQPPVEEPPVIVPEGARLVALNMALRGEPREQTARYLREKYGLEDAADLLEDVYAKAGG